MKKYKINLKKGGRFLKRLRKEHGLTQEELAKKLKISQPYVSHVENGRRSIGTWTVFSSYCNVFGLFPESLVHQYYKQ